jgi:hypothetical protein
MILAAISSIDGADKDIFGFPKFISSNLSIGRR